MSARAVLIALAVALGGCSLVFDSGRHTEGGGADAGGGMDGGPEADAGDASVDAGDDPADAGPGRVPVTEFCPLYVDIVCNGVRDCCSRVPEDWDQSTCRSTYMDVCGATIGLVLARDYLEWDEEAAYRALMEGQAFLDDDCSLAVQDWYVDRDGFFAPIEGTRAAGADCTPPSSSETDLLASVLSCVDGQACIRGAGRWSCIAPSGLGDACTFAFDCADSGARCAGIPNVCQDPGVADGALCGRNDACESLICSRARCQPVTADSIYCPEGAGLPDAP